MKMLVCCVLLAWAISSVAAAARPALNASSSAANSSAAAAPASSTANSCYSSSCLEALGGGQLASPIGAFPRVASEGCGSQLDQYLTSGAYNRDMEIAVRSAFDAMGTPVAPDAMPQQKSSPASAATKSKQVVIFDVDETLLSNVMANPWMFTKLAGRRLHGADWLQLRQQSAQNVPAIKPVQELYKALCTLGYPIVLITGRREKQRASTETNLKSAGYGGRCANGTRNGEGGACCYTQLVMRGDDDDRIASIVKPEARKAIQDKYGFELYASIGDQFSDMNGLNPTILGFKLPNPFYYVL